MLLYYKCNIIIDTQDLHTTYKFFLMYFKRKIRENNLENNILILYNITAFLSLYAHLAFHLILIKYKTRHVIKYKTLKY